MIFETTYTKDNYPIILKDNALSELSSYLKPNEQNIVLIDQDVYKLHKDYLKDHLDSLNLKYLTIISGEMCIQMSYFESISEKLLSMNINRQSQLIAIGGVATGDFLGFLEITLLRGIDFIQVLNILFANDSTISGTVYIMYFIGKKLKIAFHLQKADILDMNFLIKLTNFEIRSSYCEIFNHAILNNE